MPENLSSLSFQACVRYDQSLCSLFLKYIRYYYHQNIVFFIPIFEKTPVFAMTFSCVRYSVFFMTISLCSLL